MISIEVIEFAVAALAVAASAYLGAKYGAGMYAKLSALASDLEGAVAEVEEAFPAEKGGIYESGKQFLADLKDMLADGKISVLEARRQLKDGEAIYCDLLDLYASLKSA